MQSITLELRGDFRNYSNQEIAAIVEEVLMDDFFFNANGDPDCCILTGVRAIASITNS